MKTLKLTEENKKGKEYIGGYLYDLGTEKEYLNKTQNPNL